MTNTKKVTDYFNGDTMAASVWADKYAVKDRDGNQIEDTPADMHLRMAKEFARIEWGYKRVEEINSIDGNRENFENLSEYGKSLLNKRCYQTESDITTEIFNYFDKFGQIIPQGSIMSNLGNEYVFGSLSNCFGIESPKDSYGGICKTDQEQVQLMKRRGGVGFTLDNLRPSNSAVTNAAKTSSGVPSFAERFSNSTREVAQAGRRGALMLLLSCKHPDIFKFVTMKDDRTKVTGANVSVMFTDEFMEAVEDDETFVCTFPVNTDKIIPGYWLDHCNFNEMSTFEGVSFMMIHAKELFNLVAEMAHKNGEPGIAFIDRIKDYCPDGVYTMYAPTTCNPCGEQWFSADETCRLIAENYFTIVDNPFTDNAKVNTERLYEQSYMQQRLGDDLVDLEVEHIDRIIDKILDDPEDMSIKQVELNLWRRIRIKAEEGRRTGGGFTGLGDMLAALGLKYDSDEGIQMIKIVSKIKMEAELDCTIDMAILRGTFTGWDKELEFPLDLVVREGANSFYKMLVIEFSEQASRMCKYGRRNVSWSTVAPTGTVSLMTQTTSGLEPLFKAYYIRRKKINPNDKSTRIDFVDQNGDKWQEYSVLHPKFKEWLQIYLDNFIREKNSWQKANFGYNHEIDEMSKDDIEHYFQSSPWYGSEANDISWEKRITIQSIIQKYTSNAISSTINLPEDVEQSVVKNIYLSAYHMGLKGITVYRDGSRSGVLINESTKTTMDKFGYNDAIKRPKELEANYYWAKANGREYAVVVGLLNNNPYEIFAFANPLMNANLKGVVTKEGSGVYSFKSVAYTIENLQLNSDHTDEVLLTRWVSLLLRHGANPKFISEQVEKSQMQITSFAKVIARVLKLYIPDQSTKEKCDNCHEETIIYEEGCKRCTSCGSSKC